MTNKSDGDEGNFTENFPAPPPFWKQFTDENVEKVKLLKEEDSEAVIPDELAMLVPPPLPEGTFRSFGQSRDVCINGPTILGSFH